PRSVLYAIFCHHGEPVSQVRINAATASLTPQWTTASWHDPVTEIDALTRTLLSVFSPSLEQAVPFPQGSRFEHVLAGLVMTADWMGSDTRFHPLAGDDSRPDAAINLLDATRWSGWHSGSEPRAVLGWYQPRGAQISLLELPLTEHLVIIEAPTGSGK